MAGTTEGVFFTVDPDVDSGALKRIDVTVRKDGNSEIATTQKRWQSYAEKHNLLGKGIDPDHE